MSDQKSDVKDLFESEAKDLPTKRAMDRTDRKADADFANREYQKITEMGPDQRSMDQKMRDDQQRLERLEKSVKHMPGVDAQEALRREKEMISINPRGEARRLMADGPLDTSTKYDFQAAELQKQQRRLDR
ncbi:MAG: hypothetical protein P9L99_11145 [Candidatus Lernaella stagnicola]|nr:hypothetical protein [Candidatus Lernaella stagnicola]